MPILVAESFISGVFDRLGYLAPFLLLVGAGAGLPVPEEVTMVGSGFLLYTGQVQLSLIVGTCIVATLLGDSIPYWLGRRFGMNAMRVPFLAKIVHPERMALLEKRFERHGNWAVFTCRFLPGVRMPGFFTAGTLGMSYPRFLICNGIGALIMAPAWILLGKVFGEKISTLEQRVQDLNQILGFALLALLLVVTARLLVRRRERQLQALEVRALPAPDPDPPASTGELRSAPPEPRAALGRPLGGDPRPDPADLAGGG